MRLPVIVAVLFACGLLAIGCSKKKEEASKLEKELLELDQPQVDNTGDTVGIADSIAVTAPDAAVAPEEAETTAMPKRPDGEGYTVQVAGCESQEYAQYLVGLYSERGYEPYMTTITVKDQLYYRVRIGLFPSVAEASQLRTDLNDRFSIEAWIDYTN